MNPLFEEINKAYYLYIKAIDLADDGDFRVLLQVGHLGDRVSKEEADRISENETEASLISGAQPVIVDDTCPTYEVLFECCICHQIRDEVFVHIKENNVYEGNYFRVYTKSDFLDHLSSTLSKNTIEAFHSTSDLKHYSILTTNQWIDVFATEPEIRKIEKKDSNQAG